MSHDMRINAQAGHGRRAHPAATRAPRRHARPASRNAARRIAAAALGALLVLAPGALPRAADAPSEAPSETARATEARYLNLLKELRCLVCQNQSLAESDAGLAGDLRAQVRRMLDAGASDDEILEFMTARYGDFVRYRPPLEPATYALWGAPYLIAIVLGALLYRRLRRRAAAAKPPSA